VFYLYDKILLLLLPPAYKLFPKQYKKSTENYIMVYRYAYKVY